MTMRFEFKKDIGLAEIIALIAIILSFVAFSKGCKNEKIIKSNDFLIRANQFQPQILSIGEPQLEKFSLIIDSIIKTPDGAEIEGHSKLKFKLNIRNTGNYKANIQIVSSKDTLTYNPIIREQFLKNCTIELVQSESFDDRIFEIFPNEKKSIPFDFKINSISDDKFILHIFLLYSNDLVKINNLYDTYFWFEYHFDSTFELEKGIAIYQGMEYSMPLEKLKLIDHNISSKIYTIEELNEVIDTYELKYKNKLEN